MKFQNVTTRKGAKNYITEAGVIIERKAEGSTFAGAPTWYIKNGRWGHEYTLTQDIENLNKYSIIAICSDPYDTPFTIEFTTEQKPRSFVEVLSAVKGFHARRCKSERSLQWTRNVTLFISTLIQHGYCKA